MSNESIYHLNPYLPYHQCIRLQNFTVFKDVTLEFVPGINVIVGANDVGKTHLLKSLYAVQYGLFLQGRAVVNAMIFNFQNIFLSNAALLIRRSKFSSPPNALLDGVWGNHLYTRDWSYTFEQDGTVNEAENRIANKMTRPIYIPATDMMAHTRRFVATYDEYKIDFDQTYRDIVSLLLSPERRSEQNNDSNIDLLSKVLGGELEEENERFFLRTQHGRFAMPLVAEGLRKIATLYQLLKNGFLKPGDVLFWDEPEVNLNPSLMDELIGVLLALARTGVQIFLATHSYVILKELDLQSTAADKVRYFALEPTDDGTVVHATDDYAQIEPNAIADQYDSLYDRQLTRSTGRIRAK